MTRFMYPAEYVTALYLVLHSFQIHHKNLTLFMSLTHTQSAFATITCSRSAVNPEGVKSSLICTVNGLCQQLSWLLILAFKLNSHLHQSAIYKPTKSGAHRVPSYCLFCVHILYGLFLLVCIMPTPRLVTRFSSRRPQLILLHYAQLANQHILYLSFLVGNHHYDI